MKDNVQKDPIFYKLEKKNIQNKSNSNSIQKHDISKSIEKLYEINSDIDKLYKKYAKIKKERLIKEKDQQILVNRLKVLRHQQNSSKNKEVKRNTFTMVSEVEQKRIHVKKNSKYKKSSYNLLKKYKESGMKYNDTDENKRKNKKY